jgi:hypothetical protein
MSAPPSNPAPTPQLPEADIVAADEPTVISQNKNGGD